MLHYPYIPPAYVLPRLRNEYVADHVQLGVYYQAFMLAPAQWRRVASWICGWLYVVGNITITLAVQFGTALFFVGCVNVYVNEDGEGVLAGEPYQVYLIFLGLTILCNLVVALGNRWLPWLDVSRPSVHVAW